MMTHKIAFMNFKGGCTKTSSTMGIGAALARSGKRVLVVDCDPQGHVGLHLGIKQSELDKPIESVLGRPKGSITDVAIPTTESNLWVAPSGRGLINARHEFAMRLRRDELLDKIIRPVDGEYDFILIDTPPDEGLLSINAMYACDWIIIPTLLATFSLSGFNTLIKSIEDMRLAYENGNFNVLGVLVNCFDGRLRIENRQGTQALKNAFGDLIFNTHIRADESVRQAQTKGKTIFQFNERSKGAEDFRMLSVEILNRLEREE